MNWKRLGRWTESVLRPVLVSVLTAGTLFFLALILKPKIYDLFAPPVRLEYPLICYVEPVAIGEDGKRRVEFYIINRGREITRDELQQILETMGPEDRGLRADVRLSMKDDRGTIDSVVYDSAFNAGKGSFDKMLDEDRRSTVLRFNRIAQRAIVRADLYISGLREFGVPVVRTAKIGVPFEYDHLQDGCFGTGK